MGFYIFPKNKGGKNKKKLRFWPLIIFLLLLGGLASAVFIVKYSQDIRSHATTDTGGSGGGGLGYKKCWDAGGECDSSCGSRKVLTDSAGAGVGKSCEYPTTQGTVHDKCCQKPVAKAPSTKSTGVGATCNVHGYTGSCKNRNTTSCSGFYDSENHCPGGSNIQCCLYVREGNKPPSNGCTKKGGTCLNRYGKQADSCKGTWKTNYLCPGPDDVQCCVPK